jgi:hypothetical protein
MTLFASHTQGAVSAVGSLGSIQPPSSVSGSKGEVKVGSVATFGTSPTSVPGYSAKETASKVVSVINAGNVEGPAAPLSFVILSMGLVGRFANV